MSEKQHIVHVRINDAATGQPTPARVRFTSRPVRTERYHAPFGRLAEFATGVNEDVGGNLRLGQASWCIIDGACEIALPAGPITLEIHKGLEFKPLRQEVTLAEGKLALRFNLERWLDLRAEGWYAGDGRAHFLSPHAALLEGAAEDLAVVNLLALHWQPAPRSPALPNLDAFSGQQPALERTGHMVVVNTLNTSPLGQLALLNCHRVVFPLNFSRINWTLADWCDQCHRKGGLVAWPEHQFWPLEPDDDCVNEGLAEIILGRVDALEVDLLPWRGQEEPDWYTLLNCGLRLPLFGSSRKRCNTTALGCVRTYALLKPGEEFNYKNWIEAVRAGRTFVTNGPLLFLTINGQQLGSILELPAETRTVHVRAEARCLAEFDRLEIIRNGEIVADQVATGSPPEAVLELDVPVTEGGWWAARCWGDRRLQSSFCPQPIGAHTSPIYVVLKGRPAPADAEAVAAILEHLDRFEQMLARLERQQLFDSVRDRERLAAIYQEARERLRERLPT